MTIDDAVNKTVMLIIFTSDGLEAAGVAVLTHRFWTTGAIRLACGSKTPSSRPRVCVTITARSFRQTGASWKST